MGDLYSFIQLLGIVGGCSVRSKLLQLAAPINSTVDFTPDVTELADYILIFKIRGPGIGTNVRYSLLAPPVAGSYDIVDDDFTIALGGSRDQGLLVRFSNFTGTSAYQIEVDYARFSTAQLEDLRCLVGFASQAAAALLQKQLADAGIGV
jgi:hypothetical protein